MQAARVFDLNGRQVVIRELTLGEIRAWLADVADQSQGGDLIDALLFEDFDPAALVKMTALSAADLDGYAPSDLRRLAEACREVNRDFFAMRERMVQAQRALLSQVSSARG